MKRTTIFFIETYFNEDLKKYFIKVINKISKYEEIILINLNFENLNFDENELNEEITLHNITVDFELNINKKLAKINKEKDIQNIVFLENYAINKIKENELDKKITKILILNQCYIGLINEITKMEEFDFDPFYYSIPKLANLEWNAIKKADKIVTLSKFLLDELSKYYKKELEHKQIYFIKTGIDKNEYTYYENDNSQWILKSNLNFENGMRYFLKNTKVKDINPGVIIGYGSYSIKIKNKFLEKEVKNYSLVTEKKYIELLKSVQFCLFPSVYEPWCLALNEAMAMGKIVIVQSGKSGLTEQVKDSINGFHFDFKKDSIYEFINKIQNKDLKRISLNASKSIDKLEDTTEKLKEVLL